MRKSALRLVAVDRAAAGEGLRAGMTLADARARVPELEVADADPAADLAFLMRVAETCRRFTPALALHAPDGLDLDVTGCAALFGGEARLLMAMAAMMQRWGLALRSALADTPALAYAAARFGSGGVVTAGCGRETLEPLPMEALRLDPQACTVLRQLGFRRIGQLLETPRAALARRLGEDALHRLDEALGARAGPLELNLEQPPFRAERRLFEPVTEVEQVLQVAADLSGDLALQLDGRAVGGRRFTLELYRVDGAVRRLEVAASRPIRHAPQIAALFAERVAGLNEGLQADFGFDQLRLTATRTDPRPTTAGDLLTESAPPSGLDALADRLTARTRRPVHRLASVDVHTPEGAQAHAELEASAAWATDPAHAPARFLDTPLRPLRLFRPPQPIEVAATEVPEGAPARFTWRRLTRTVVRAEGPERLEPEWALNPEARDVRDYYRLEDDAGRRYWVFRQGRYDAPTVLASPERPTRAEIKPVRAPPKPPPALLRLAHPAPPSRSPHPVEGGATSLAPPAEDPAPRPRPAWFLHGLFG